MDLKGRGLKAEPPKGDAEIETKTPKHLPKKKKKGKFCPHKSASTQHPMIEQLLYLWRSAALRSSINSRSEMRAAHQKKNWPILTKWGQAARQPRVTDRRHSSLK